MKFYSTNKKSRLIDFKEALMLGLAPDGGLFMPLRFPRSRNIMQIMRMYANDANSLDLFHEIALEISKQFVTDIPKRDLTKIIKESFTFEVPLKQLDSNLYILELFHGPTLAFKDFGARFMARVMNYYLKQDKKILNIIVATSGDTGSAVAQGFYGLSNIKVFVLYPSKRITKFQEKQMATLGKNIIALEVRGNFDDCQKLAKQALADEELKKKINLSSANSINFGRLLPQLFYYFWGLVQYYCHRKTLKLRSCDDLIFAVPSGNFGNLTAGLIAKKMGLPVSKFIAATNTNDIVPQYLKTGVFKPRVSEKTISNAMDVGSPSNFARMLEMYKHDYRLMAKDVLGISVSDRETRQTIKSIYQKTGYILDPHTAVGVAAAQKYQSSPSTGSGSNLQIVVLATAHPAKFKEIVEPIIKKKIDLPRQLKAVIKKNKKSVLLPNNYAVLKRILLGD